MREKRMVFRKTFIDETPKIWYTIPRFFSKEVFGMARTAKDIMELIEAQDICNFS